MNINYYINIILMALLIIFILNVLISYIKMLSIKIPGPLPLPLIGIVYRFKLNGVEFLNQLLQYGEFYAKETGLFSAFIGNHHCIMITRAKIAETLLASTGLISKSYFYKFLLPWLGTGLLTSAGDKWHSRRKMLTRSFHFKILQDSLLVFNEQGIKLVKILKSEQRGSFDISKNITNCTLDIICETAMGKIINAQDHYETSYVKAIYRISEIIVNRMKFPWLWPNFIFYNLSIGKEHNKLLSILHDFTISVINERRNTVKSNINPSSSSAEFIEKRRLAFLDLLLEAEERDGLSQEDLREEVDTFMFEGHDTTAAGIQWAIQLIAQHPKVQKRLQEEIDLIFENKDELLNMDDISQLKYLECVIKETLRLFPPVPMFSREVTEDTEFGNFVVRKGSTATILVQAVHRDPEYFPDPNKFLPERFMKKESGAKIHLFAYIPFSAGQRNCIGQKFAMLEEKVILSYLIHNFELTSQVEMAELRACGELILRPEKGVYVEIKQRRNVQII